jgi:uncharacterized repeat protein (TIGR03806 family)
VRFHDAAHYPERLSAWGVFVRDGDHYLLGQGVEPYDINSALFTDYAAKLRAVYMPPGTRARYAPDGPFDLPVGSIVMKTFYYPQVDGHAIPSRTNTTLDPANLDAKTHRVIETRLLVRQPHGWDALPYVWDGDDAFLRVTGDLQPIELSLDGNLIDLPYVVPTRNECAGCHATHHDTRAIHPIGLQARHLNGPDSGGPGNQLEAWQARSRLAGLPDLASVPRAADWQDPAEPIEARARAYLDINCGHCHNANGAAATSGLLLDAATSDFRQLGICKRPIAAGRGSGGHQYSIVPGRPEASILVFRMNASDPAIRMPELGRSLVHEEAVRVISDWIAALPGECV